MMVFMFVGRLYNTWTYGVIVAVFNLQQQPDKMQQARVAMSLAANWG